MYVQDKFIFNKAALENAVAISETIHTDKNFNSFYKIVCTKGINGFTGIYDLCVSMAEAMTTFEQQGKELWEEHDWVSVVENYCNQVIELGLSPTEAFEPNLNQMLLSAIKFASF